MKTSDTSVPQSKPAHSGAAWLYLSVTLCVFVALALAFLLLPRPKYSELEKRDLDTVPEFSFESLRQNQYTAALSQWFSDTNPLRETLMGMSMSLRDGIRLNFGGDEAISFHAADNASAAAPADDVPHGDDLTGPSTADIDEGVAKIAHSGIVVVGTPPKVRALMAYGGVGGGDAFAEMARTYAAELPGTRIYAVVVPLASEFYLPDKAKSASKPQITTIESIKSKLGPVLYVDAYNALKAHTDEDIYLRTDHHWSPLGAYYAAEQLAKVAGVPFRHLDTGSYQPRTIKRFVGSMFGYSQDKAVKESPEDFVYYLPTGVSYNATFRRYSLTKDFKVSGESAPYQSPYFKSYSDGSGMAYSTFMGGDSFLVVVKTGTHNGRRIVIIKDSYGNAVPGYLFYSFEEVHVVDFRYFTHNMRAYCAANGITDLAFVFNIFNAYSSGSAARMKRFLTQSDGEYSPATPAEKPAATTPAPSASQAEQPSEPMPEQPAEPAPEPEPTPEPAE